MLTVFIIELTDFLVNLISDILNYDKYRKIMADPEQSVKRKTLEYLLHRAHIVMIPSFLFMLVFWIILPKYLWIAIIAALIPYLFVIIGAISGHKNKWKKYVTE
jgi:hypothetical protein